MNSSEVIQSVYLSLGIGVLSAAAGTIPATAAAFFLSRSNFRGKTVLEGMINLPLVMPPVTTGYLLLIILGKNGVIGSILFDIFGLRIAFTTAAAVIASMVVSFPLITRNIKTAMDMVDPKLEKAAQTLGAGKSSVFFRITLPLIMPGIISGIIVGFARSMGEFGATMIFAGNIQGKTRTIPLSVYSFLQTPGKEKEAALLICISASISFLAMFFSSHLVKRLKRQST